MFFLIKYATKSRPSWFKKAIENIQSTIHTKDYLILVSADEDDPTMNNSEMIGFCMARENIKLVFGHSKSKIEAINANMDEAGEWDILVCMSDDMVFIKMHWDKIIERDMAAHFPNGDCFLHYNDGFAKDALATMTIIDRKYYERDRYIYYPEYKSFSCDAESYYVAKTRGRHHYFDEILATHQHPANVKIGKDELYRVNSLHTPFDTELYWRRLHTNFDLEKEGYTSPWLWDKFKKH